MAEEKEYFNVADIFGENVFNDAVMQERLPKKVYQKLKQTISDIEILFLHILKKRKEKDYGRRKRVFQCR